MNLKINEELKKHIWPLKPEEFKQLEENILSEGIRDKIITWQGFIIDGHNRYEIACRHNLLFETLEFEFDNIEAVKDWMDANQLGRRNLTEDQWQISIGRRYNREKKAATGRSDRSFGDANFTTPKTEKKLSEEYKVSPRTIHNYAQKAKQFEKLQEEKPELSQAIWSGEKSFKEIRKEEKKEEFLNNIELINQKAKSFDDFDGLYDVVVIDPPWPYEVRQSDVSHGMRNPYPMMSIDKLSKVNIPAAENCIMWLWTTNAFMREAFMLLDAWGFKQKSILTWAKDRFNLGDWLNGQTEHAILAVKGKPLMKKGKSTLLNAPRRAHSQKPDEFYDMVKEICPGRRIDIFSRCKREGFDEYGSEEGKFY